MENDFIFLAWEVKYIIPKDSLFGTPDSLYIGMDWTEGDRMVNFRKEKHNWQVEFPMAEWDPIWDKCRMADEWVNLGYPLPRAYQEGFPHNNCGRRCVRAGISHFVHLYHVDKPAFVEWADEEAATNIDFRRRGVTSEDYSILADRRGGTRKALPLATLAARIESGEKFPTDEWGGCGCGTTN